MAGDFLFYVDVLKIGVVVGFVEPPAGSSVTATTACCGTVPLRCTALVLPEKRPAGRAACPVGITQAS
jgi:hypothetical protein